MTWPSTSRRQQRELGKWAAKYGATAMVKDDWKLKCTYTGCSAGAEGAPFKTPALAPADALARLGLHRESTHGKQEDDAGEDAERIHCPNQPSPEVEHVLQPAKHSAAGVTRLNRMKLSQEERGDHKKDATEDNDLKKDPKADPTVDLTNPVWHVAMT